MRKTPCVFKCLASGDFLLQIHIQRDINADGSDAGWWGAGYAIFADIAICCCNQVQTGGRAELEGSRVARTPSLLFEKENDEDDRPLWTGLCEMRGLYCYPG